MVVLPFNTRVVTVSAQLVRIKCCVAAYFAVEPEALDASAHNRSISYIRRIAWWIARETKTEAGLPFSYPEIARAYNRDHSTVMTGVRIIQKLIDNGDKRTAVVCKVLLEASNSAGERADTEAIRRLDKVKVVHVNRSKGVAADRLCRAVGGAHAATPVETELEERFG